MAFGFDVNNYGNSSEYMYMLDVADIVDEPHHDETLIAKPLPPGTWEIVCTSKGATVLPNKTHVNGEIALAAACYALPEHIQPLSVETGMITGVFLTVKRIAFWPWLRKWWKPTPDNRIKELTKAGALIAAEIDRLQNLQPSINAR
jgi:hypothetical protein